MIEAGQQAQVVFLFLVVHRAVFQLKICFNCSKIERALSIVFLTLIPVLLNIPLFLSWGIRAVCGNQTNQRSIAMIGLICYILEKESLFFSEGITRHALGSILQEVLDELIRETVPTQPALRAESR